MPRGVDTSRRSRERPLGERSPVQGVEVLPTARAKVALGVLVVIGGEDVEGLEVEAVGQATLAAVMAPAVAPRRRRTISPAQLLKRRYLAFGGERDSTFDRVGRYARKHGFEDPFTPRVPHIETLRDLAAAEVGYALLPTYTTRRDREQGRLIAPRPEGLEDLLPVSIVGREGQARTTALDAVRNALIAVGDEVE